jgi:hypothetical protein
MVGTAQDVTEWKQLQEELQHAQKMEAGGRLGDGIAHEFNNLLTIIGGYTHAALSKIDETGQRPRPLCDRVQQSNHLRTRRKVDEHALLAKPFMPNTLLQRIRETLDETLTT